MLRRMLWVGVDIGGTFTDVVVYDEAGGAVVAGKGPSTPEDPSAGVLAALGALGIELKQVSRFRHGSTMATNTVLERKGARLGVLTTAGHRDVLIVGRGNREKLYDIKATRAPGLVRRSDIVEVAERLDATGAVLLPLDEADVAAAASGFAERGIEAIAVCFLHSYAEAGHERRAAEILATALPGVPVSISAEILPRHREYERFATTALNAYVAPRMGRYLDRLGAALADKGLASVPEIMTSSGGSWPFALMARQPVNSTLSGPAAGVIGAAAMAAALKIPNLITYDMGGTSTDTCLIRGGDYALASEGEIGGLPNRAPQLEINTVGAGGGSLAYLDDGGFLNVGPRSAGAVPGPACYGRGGEEPTVTDANVVLGRFRPRAPLGGEIEIDAGAAERAIDGLAGKLGLDRMATAEGIVRIAVTRMTGAIKEISVMRGLDPRDFALFAFGGAGPLHAALIAEELGLARVIVPPLPGTFSAYGLLVADRRHDLVTTRLLRLDDDSLAEVLGILEQLRHEGDAALAAEGFTAEHRRFQSFIDLRFVGQAFELTTPVPETVSTAEELLKAFQRVYEERYAHADDGPVEAVAFRVSAIGLTAKPRLRPAAAGGRLEGALLGHRAIHLAGRDRETPVYRRDRLPVGARTIGPALVDEDGSVTLVPEGFSLALEQSGALVLTREASR